MGDLRHRSPKATVNPPEDPGGGDAVLVAQAQHGDAAAFALLYRRHVNQIYGFAARRVVDHATAEEVTQEIFVRALAGLLRCERIESFRGWLFAIARHVISEQYRDVRRAGPMPVELIEIEDPDPTPETAAEHAEAVTELRAARERCLSEQERELFDLLLAGLTDREIAAAQGRRAGAVRTAHWRLLITLRGCLGIAARTTGGQRVAF